MFSGRKQAFLELRAKRVSRFGKSGRATVLRRPKSGRHGSTALPKINLAVRNGGRLQRPLIWFGFGSTKRSRLRRCSKARIRRKKKRGQQFVARVCD